MLEIMQLIFYFIFENTFNIHYTILETIHDQHSHFTQLTK